MVKNPRLRKRDFDLNPQKINIISFFGVLGVSLLLGGYTYLGQSDFQSRYDTNASEIAKLEGDLKELKENAGSVSVKEIQQSLNSAVSLGNQVSELQNTWGTALTAEDTTAFNVSGGQSVDLLNKTRVERLLAIFGDNDKAGSAMWYAQVKGTKAERSSWKFITTTSFASTKQNVMWQCLGEDGELYAYVTAIYNADDNTFDSTNVVVTTAGSEAQGG